MSVAAFPLLDRRYRITQTLSHVADERHYLAWHVELAIPVHITAISLGSLDGNVAHLTHNVQRSPLWDLVPLAAMLRHPALPRIRDCFNQGETLYIVMDTLDECAGARQILATDSAAPLASHAPSRTPRTLATRVADVGPLTPSAALCVAMELCDALACVQAQLPELLPLRVITPQNVQLLMGGAVTLGSYDFRRWHDTSEPVRDAIVSDCIYQAPEERSSAERSGHPHDVRADIWSVGALLYYALTGEEPLGDVSALIETHHDLPGDVRAIIAQATRTSPAQRFQTADTLGATVAAALLTLQNAAKVGSRGDNGATKMTVDSALDNGATKPGGELLMTSFVAGRQERGHGISGGLAALSHALRRVALSH